MLVCSVISLRMRTYWIILMEALLTTITVFYLPSIVNPTKREECSVIGLRMHTYWLTLISTLIPTLNVPIYKF